MAEKIWAPWRMEYILSPKPDGCVFCTALSDGPERYEENLVLYEGTTAFIIMNRYPYTHGHIMVLPKKHVSTLEELGQKEAGLLRACQDKNAYYRAADQYSSIMLLLDATCTACRNR